MSGTLMLAHCAIASAVEIDAGPIWNDGDARGKCPAV